MYPAVVVSIAVLKVPKKIGLRTRVAGCKAANTSQIGKSNESSHRGRQSTLEPLPGALPRLETLIVSLGGDRQGRLPSIHLQAGAPGQEGAQVSRTFQHACLPRGKAQRRCAVGTRVQKIPWLPIRCLPCARSRQQWVIGPCGRHPTSGPAAPGTFVLIPGVRRRCDQMTRGKHICILGVIAGARLLVRHMPIRLPGLRSGVGPRCWTLAMGTCAAVSHCARLGMIVGALGRMLAIPKRGCQATCHISPVPAPKIQWRPRL